MSRLRISLAFLVFCCAPLFSLHAGITRTWTGAVNAFFSQSNNWSPAGVPAVDDSLVFTSATVNNDLTPGRAFGPITFDGDVTLNGNAMTLMGDVIPASSNAKLTCNADVKIGMALTLGSGVQFETYPSMDVNGQTLTVGGSAIVQSLNGTGTVLTQRFFEVRQGGTFAGTIAGDLIFAGSMPNANVVHNTTDWPVVNGGGTLGTVEAGTILLAGTIYGPLKTKSLHIRDTTVTPNNGAFFDLNATGTSDLIQVAGTVTLENVPLNVTVRSGIPVAGQKFELIDNDGGDPVSGTFLDLPEGATVSSGGFLFTISYHGGDGNDVVLTFTSKVTKVWNGSVNSLWSNPGNWTPNAIPLSGEALTFPDNVTMTNDLPAGTMVGALYFNGDATLNGNPLTLTGAVTAAPGSTVTLNATLKIGSSLAFEGEDRIVADSIDVNGQTLTFSPGAGVTSLNGSGTVISDLTQVTGGTFAGTFMGSIALLGGSMPNADIVHLNSHWPTVVGRGTLGNVEAAYVSGDNAYIGILKTKSFHVRNAGDGFPGVVYYLNTTGTSDQIQANGTVTLENPALVVNLTGTPQFGQHFLLIDNDGTDPVSGTFDGLPEGAAVNANGNLFRITYTGGDGNDVEIVMAATPSAGVSQGADTSKIGEPVALQAAVSSQLGTPAGTVTFLDNGVAIGTAPLSNGTATLHASTLSVGSHSITAVYSGGGAFFGATSGPMTHTVFKGESTTSLASVHVPALFGAAELRVLSAPVAPAAGTIGGTFTIREGNNILGGGTLSGGSGHVFLPTLPVGTHTLIASYSGSDDFVGSGSAPFTIEVSEAPTQVQASKDGSTSSTDGTVVLDIAVTPLTSASVPPTGTITISESGVVWSQQPVTGSLAVTLRLPGGHRALTIGYSGDSNFLPSATELDLDVDAAPPARRRAVHH